MLLGETAGSQSEQLIPQGRIGVLVLYRACTNTLEDALTGRESYVAYFLSLHWFVGGMNAWMW